MDILRGLLAFGVMCYHYSLWSAAHVDVFARSFLSKIGIYGVETFFIISGFSLLYVYRYTDFSLRSNTLNFYWKRFWRIAPLFYFAVFLVLVLKGIATRVLHEPTASGIETGRILLNVSFLFGLLNPAASMVVAGWSIGVEMVFYLLFPVAAWMSSIRFGLPVLFIASWISAAIFASVTLSPAHSLADQWPLYVFFLNHWFFFVGGMLLVPLRERYRFSPLLFWITVPILLLFLVWDLAYASDESLLVVGYQRHLLSLVCFMIAFLFSTQRFQEGKVREALVHLGNVSYSVYLLHFFSYLALSRVLKGFSMPVVVGAAVLLTVVAASVTYRFLERPLMRFSHRSMWGVASTSGPTE